MKYENAQKGISRIFTAVIIHVIAGILATFTIVFADSITGPAIVAALIALVATIVSLALEISGMFIAARDGNMFKIGVGIVFASMVLDVIYCVCNLSGTDDVYLSFLDSLTIFLEAVYTMTICLGISKIFEKEGSAQMANRGILVGILYLVSFAIIGSLEILTNDTIGFVKQSGTLASILFIVCMALESVTYIFYLFFLDESRKKIREFK